MACASEYWVSEFIRVLVFDPLVIHRPLDHEFRKSSRRSILKRDPEGQKDTAADEKKFAATRNRRYDDDSRHAESQLEQTLPSIAGLIGALTRF